MIEIEPGIYQLPLPLPNRLGYVNSYLLKGDRANGCLLIDTGWNTEEAFESMKKQLAETGVNLADISRILITHAHPDHYGLAGRLRRHGNAQVLLHEEEKNFIESRYINTDKLLQQLARWLYTNGVPQSELTALQTASLGMLKFVTPVLPNVTLHGGETITTGYLSFKALWTPGHSAGHICLYEPTKKLLFAGDHILPSITPHIGLHPQAGDNPLGDYLKSLNSLKKLDVKLVLPGHGGAFTNFKPRIEELIQHHRRRNSEILRALKAKPKTAYQAATEITWVSNTKRDGWVKLDHWSKRMAVLETLSHLEAMRANKEVAKSVREGIIYYRPTKDKGSG